MARKGEKLTEATKQKMSDSHKGFKYGNWKCGVTGARRRGAWRQSNWWKTYSLRPEDVVSILKRQNGRCPICDRLLDMRTLRAVSVDHDHITGQVRGILHPHCNRLLGLVEIHTLLDRLSNINRYLSTSS